MSGVTIDFLFTLIKALGKAEKRHFKVYAGKHVIGDKNTYVKLFDAINKQKKYNKSKLLKQKIFRDLPSLRKRLYGAILKSLEEYHSSVSIDARSELNRIEILYAKSLFFHCQRIIKNLKSNCMKYDLHAEMLEALKWEDRIAMKNFDSAKRDDMLGQINKIIRILSNQHSYREMENDLTEIFQQFGVLKKINNNKVIHKFINNSLFQNQDSVLSLPAKRTYLSCHFFYFLLRGNLNSAYSFGRKLVDSYDNIDYFIAPLSFAYLNALNNALVLSNELRKYDEMLGLLAKLQEHQQKLYSKSDKTIAFFYNYNFLNYYVSTGQFADAKYYLKRIENELPIHEPNINYLEKMFFYYVIATVYFGQENYKRCIYWLNRALALGNMKIRKDIDSHIRLLNIIANYEMKSDPVFMNSLIRSAYHYLDKEKEIHKINILVLDFLKNLMRRSPSRSNTRESFKHLKSKLKVISIEKNKKMTFEGFDFVSWIDSKIENRTLAEVVQQKALT